MARQQVPHDLQPIVAIDAPRPTRRPEGRGGGTKALIGRHSKDRLVSIFLEERRMVSQDGEKWPPLSGLVTIDPAGTKQLALQHYVPYAQVQSILIYRTPLGAVIEKVVYDKCVRLTEAAGPSEGIEGTGDALLEGTQPGRQRYPFSFEFGKETLPPSFCFDPSDVTDGLPLGLHWEVKGFLGRRIVTDADGTASLDRSGVVPEGSTCTIQKQSPASLNFLVEHKHTATGLALSPMTSTQTLRPSLFSFGRSAQPETTLTADVESPLCSPEEPLKVRIALTKLHKSHKVQRIRLVAKQVINIRLPTAQQLQFKANVAVLDELPAPRYEPANNNDFSATISVKMGDGIPARAKKGKTPAQLLPLEWSRNHGVPASAREFVASTPPSQSEDEPWGLEIGYFLKVQITLLDSAGAFGAKERDMSVSLPFVLTGATREEPPTSAHPSLSQTRRASESSDTVLTPDALLPLLAETLDDLEQSVNDVAALRLDWRSLRGESSNCTNSSDHAQDILDILATLAKQLEVFADGFAARDGAVRWPRNPIPFNMMVLEMELLIRAAPTEFTVSDGEGNVTGRGSVVDKVLKATDGFFQAGKSVVLAWVASRGGEHGERETSEFKEKMEAVEAAAGALRAGLESIVAGADRESGRRRDAEKGQEEAKVEDGANVIS